VEIQSRMINDVFPADCLLPPASCFLPPADCLLPTAYCLLPPADFLTPSQHIKFLLLHPPAGGEGIVGGFQLSC
jgi:hypothetical protein